MKGRVQPVAQAHRRLPLVQLLPRNFPPHRVFLLQEHRALVPAAPLVQVAQQATSHQLLHNFRLESKQQQQGVLFSRSRPGVATTTSSTTEGTIAEEIREMQCGYEPGRLIFLQDGAPKSDSCLPRRHTFCNHIDEDCCGPATCQLRPGISLHQCLAPGDAHK